MEAYLSLLRLCLLLWKARVTGPEREPWVFWVEARFRFAGSGSRF